MSVQSSVHPTNQSIITQALSELTHAQKDRLAFIDFSLQYFGHVARTDLIQRFKTGLAASTRDFSAYKEIAPDNLILKHQTKSYHRTDSFHPVFNHDPEVILTSLSRGFGNGISTGVQPSEQCFDAVRLIHPEPAIIAGIMRAIHNKKAIICGYVSVSSGESVRALVPHSIVNNGHRWHVRAYDRKNNSFRDFVCTRFTHVEVMPEEIHAHEGAHYDQQWQQIVELVLIPHPSIKQPKAIEMDYAMQDGKLVLQLRAAVAAYVLRQWQVDCSAGHKVNSQGFHSALAHGCQLALANHSVLEQIDSAGLLLT
ncbi:WYL domain-containing protein [Paraglaciecola aquimarina]|uniref:WYL domain-containing protein n=1 Tax=Paraglaciecola algarum TaxID=3050085 RepID=A0ABS9D8S4_9ALTE|nr:WYL domain-containing protein [Paraglaciecola sp. G1-23]MCF2948204.1 WYL domain-containing protein [Paraglaciecola sp. G1-23]